VDDLFPGVFHPNIVSLDSATYKAWDRDTGWSLKLKPGVVSVP